MRVYFHRCCITSEAGITRTTTIVLKPKIQSHLGYLYQVCNEDITFEFANRVSSGTQQPYVTWDALSKYFFCYPNDNSLIDKYCNLVNGIISQILINERNICSLLEYRDELIPLFMNGQVTID